MQERTCTKCGETKPETVEYFRKRGNDHRGGLRPDCRDCSAARDREFYQRNRERQLLVNAAYRARSKDATRTRDAAYVATSAGRASRRRASAKWNATPQGRELARHLAERRRAMKAGAEATLTVDDWAACLAYFDHRCAYCGTDGPMQQEHVVPLIREGEHTATNVVTACRPCNGSKFTADMEPWFRRQPFFDPARLAKIADYFTQSAE
jgi:5-methylcytosine-specific restriction endonuclease McrA